MRKLVLLTICVFTFFSCSGDDDMNTDGISCTQASANAAAALEDFGNDPSTANCLEVRQALEAQRDACGDATGAIAAQLAALTQC